MSTFLITEGNDSHDYFLPLPYAPNRQLAHVAGIHAPTDGVHQFHEQRAWPRPFAWSNVHGGDRPVEWSLESRPR